MDGVAVIAGEALNLMLGQIPKRLIFLFAVAGEAFGRLGLGVGEFLAEDENPHASLTALFHMGRSRAMAGLAIFLAGRAAGDGLFGMSRHHVGVITVLMAAFADFYSHRAIARSCL